MATIKIITSFEYSEKYDKEIEYISHGIDVDTMQNVILQQLTFKEYLNQKLIIFDKEHGWILK